MSFPPSVLQDMARSQIGNEATAKYFAASMAGIIVLIASIRLTAILFNRYASAGIRKSVFVRPPIITSRYIRSVLLRKVPGFSSAGHALLVVTYVAINLILLLTNINWATRIGIAKRCGWLALLNICFITFLALKNTPLAFLTIHSYEKLNCLHQIGGYTVVAFVIVHFSMMSDYMVTNGYTMLLLEKPQICAMVAGISMVLIGATATFLRKMQYEVFYVIHVTLFLLILITVAMHRPSLAEKAVYIPIVTGCLWAADRIVRLGRLLWNLYGTRAHLTPLANGGTRIVLSRSSTSVVPGAHCMLWIPAIRSLESHPFTIASSTATTLEFVVSAQDGFTRHLHEYAVRNPGASLRASFHGPYGVFPNLSKSAERVVLVAGGSGASFTFGVALDMIAKVGVGSSTKSIDFIWVVKHRDTLSWFSKEMAQLVNCPLVNLSIHCTSTGGAASNSPPTTASDSSDQEKGSRKFSSASSSTALGMGASRMGSESDVEKQQNATRALEVPSAVHILPGRPDVAFLISGVVDGAEASDRIVVAACGPHPLMNVVRSTVADCVGTQGPSISYHYEEFGW
ncbi:hypothetical protein BP5796_10534 [Coleophoma crateriformis]|uniref:ferric-chelate reductase (NADPH) n=1 Tax=Coleophoma crateriformis TaxID=565419 RepID=A0A3D8QQG0_9HELO|nr:hypothetical protein BP5796_10534 [Coleophoma crateriformis]